MRFIVDVSKENESNGFAFAGCLLESAFFLAIICIVCYLIWDSAKTFFSNFNLLKLIGLIVFIVGSIFIVINEFSKYKK